jgi:hypothetical protein
MSREGCAVAARISLRCRGTHDNPYEEDDMRGIRRTVALAVAAIATMTGSAHADMIGAGNGTGIKDWLAVYQDVGNGHSARGLCEYAVNASQGGGVYGHFETWVEAYTGGPFSGSTDATMEVTCTYYGTATGTLVMSDSGTSTPVGYSHDQAAGRPTKVCLTAKVVWSNGDTFNVVNRCQQGRVVFWKDEIISVAVSLDDGTNGVVDGATGTAVSCADVNPTRSCAGIAAAYARETAAMVASGHTPSVALDVVANPPVG